MSKRIPIVYNKRFEVHIDPPVLSSGEKQQLPFYQLGDKNFERLCARLAGLQPKVIETRLYGVNGQDQQGIDVYSRLEGITPLTVYQAKCYQEYTTENLTEVVNVFLYKNEKGNTTAQKRARSEQPEKKFAVKDNTFILCVTAVLEETKFLGAIQAEQQFLQTFGIRFEVWDAVQLTDKLRPHPEAILECFGLDWVEKICGRPAREQLDNQFETYIRIPTEDQPAKTPSGALRSERRAVPFRFRRKEFSQLLDWMHQLNEKILPMRVFTGVGGIGKTRLFLELTRVAQFLGWNAGFLEKSTPASHIPKLLERKVPTLIVVDYAEGKREQLEALIGVLVTRPKHTVRVALLARDKGGWLDTALTSHGNARAILDAEATPIQPIGYTEDKRQKTFADAAKAYANEFGDPSKPMPTPPNLNSPAFERVLTIHMSAMSAVIDITENKPIQNTEDLPTILDRLLEHEQRYWESIAKKASNSATQGIERLRRVMTVATLWGGFRDETQAMQMVQQAPLLENLNSDLDVQNDVLKELETLYPKTGKYLGGLEPDIVGERLVQVELEKPKNGDAIISLVFGNPEAPEIPVIPEMQKGIEVLVRMLEWNATSSGVLLKQVIHRRQRQLGALAYTLMPFQTIELRELAVLCGELALQAETDEWKKVGILTDLSRRYYDIGDKSMAFEAANHAVALGTYLHRLTGISVFDLYWAGALNLLGVLRSKENRISDAIVLSRASVRIYYKLLSRFKNVIDEEKLEGIFSELAMCLGNLGNRYADSNKIKPALKITQMVVEIYRKLPTQKLNLAKNLNNLGNRFHAVGNQEQAFKSSLEAVEIMRGFYAQSADANAEDYATYLISLSDRYWMQELSERLVFAKRYADLAIQVFSKVFMQYPKPSFEKMDFIVTKYLNTCKALGIKPDQILLDVILPVLKPFVQKNMIFSKINDLYFARKIL